jgi:regulatory protein
MKRQPLSLFNRAVGLLSRREHSRAELAKKLRPHAESAEEIEAVLDRLEQDKLLSDARFAESLAHRRAGRYGSTRLKMELQQQGVAGELVAATVASAKLDELAQAREVFARKFGEPADTPEGRNKQAAFLLRRGFPSGVVARVMRGGDDD